MQRNNSAHTFSSRFFQFLPCHIFSAFKQAVLKQWLLSWKLNLDLYTYLLSHHTLGLERDLPENFERGKREDKYCLSDAVKSSSTGRVSQGYSSFLISLKTLDLTKILEKDFRKKRIREMTPFYLNVYYCPSAGKVWRRKEKVLTQGSANFILQMICMCDSLCFQQHYHVTDIQVKS